MNFNAGNFVQQLMLLVWALMLASCARTPDTHPLLAASQLVTYSSEYAGNDEYIRLLYESRTWLPAKDLLVDTVEIAKRSRTPVQDADAKLLGPSREDAMRALALKIWMIESAEHTVDIVYYIFKNDLVGQAMLGALCNAVQRGVDVRLMVDAVGSFGVAHNNLRKLQDCALDAGYMRNASGMPTSYKARAQTIVINALTSASSGKNRRSHDKLLLIDGTFPGKDLVITGGRNISLDYYGLEPDGKPDPKAYRDLEILIRSTGDMGWEETGTGDISEAYFDLLFLHKGNKKLLPMHPSPSNIANEGQTVRAGAYPSAQDSLAKLKSFPDIQQMLADMPSYLNSGFRNTQVRLAHELGNLTSRNAVSRTQENLETNENSIMRIIDELGNTEKEGENDVLRIVSPYMFLARYYDKNGKVVQDDAQSILKWLKEHKQGRVEIITNSVLTSDNFMAQSIIDMDMAPRLLLSPEIEKAWLAASENSQWPADLAQSESWEKLINNPQILIYQTGRLDAAILGRGDKEYGKLHAKFIAGDMIGFVGTANFDYRSRLFNNEMGFFYQNDALNKDLVNIFEFLKSTSYRWGSPEWLEMRREVMRVRGMKGWSTRQQRRIFKFLRATGLDWLI